MYNTKCAVRLYVEAVEQSWNMMEYQARGRSLGYETSTAINTVPCPHGVIFPLKSQLLKNLEDLLR